MTSAHDIDEIAARHGLTGGAVRALAEGLARNGGRSAQWSHPDLGGMGQWMGRGMLQIGDMFNQDLKARVGAALDDLARQASPAVVAAASPGAWWPAALGQPSATGSQNDMSYACFPEARRLAVRQGGRVAVYDTGHHRLTSFAQAQSSGQVLTFSGPDGPIGVDDLRIA